MSDESCHIVATYNTAKVSAANDCIHFASVSPVNNILVQTSKPYIPSDAPVDPLTVPLTFTAEQPNSSVRLTTANTALYYRRNSADPWIPYTSETVLVLEKIGDYVQMWNSSDSLSVGNKLSTYTLSGRVAASGNIMSLANFREDVPDSCFRTLFNNCAALTTLPLLPAKKIAVHGYNQMFFGCVLLKEAKLSAVELGASGLRAMFNRCSSLQKIEVDFTSWSDSALSIWAQGVSPNGVFIKPSVLPERYGINYIPNGWTVVNKDLI